MATFWLRARQLAAAATVLAAATAAILASGGTTGTAREERRSQRANAEYQQKIKPILDRHCYSCHGTEKQKADLSLADYADVAAVKADRKLWEEVLRKLRSREMPPEGKSQPTDVERERVIAWIESELFPVDCDNPDPGRVTIRRLNRVEYNNTIRDLVGVSLPLSDDFPADDTGYGFDNIGDALSLSPLLLEKYLAAAEKIVDAAMVDGPLDQSAPPLPSSHRRILFCQPEPGKTNDCARVVVSEFARRAFRRPPTAAEIARLMGLFQATVQEGASFERGIKITLQAILVSPHFLFRGELQPDPNNPHQVAPVNEFALASRLSYFLWSSMPDEELIGLAAAGKLRKNIEAQLHRMLADPKSQALVENFAGQWLQTRMLKELTPDPGVFPSFDEELRAAMAKETELFFAHVFREDRSVLDFLSGDYTFVNERLARHYGMSGVTGPEFRRVSLKGSPRGGVLTHASVLALTSNPTRTSPVKRGKWVLENLLAQAPPPPPPGVPPLDEAKEAAEGASLRQRLELHREDPMCSSCHSIMDPIGFGLENFDGIGAWREKDGAFPIAAAGALHTGERFSGVAELRQILATKRREQFVRCLVEKMLTYAVGRGLEYYDRCAVDQIMRQMARRDYRFSALISGVVKSAPFQMRRGEGDRFADADN